MKKANNYRKAKFFSGSLIKYHGISQDNTCNLLSGFVFPGT